MFSSYREQLNTLWNGLHSNQHKWTIVLFLFILVISGIFGGSFLAGQRFPGLPLVNWESNLATTVRTTQHVSASQDALPAESPVPSQRAIELQKLQLQYAQARKTSLQSAWEAYKETHTSALREHKLFLYVPHQSGQGNKLPGIATAFMLALISHRALLIDYCKCVQDTQGECKCQWGDFFEQEELELDIVSLLARNPGLNGVIREKSLAQVDFVHDAVSLNLADLADRPVVWGNGSKDWTAHLWMANPHHGKTLRALFRPGHIFHDVAQLIMRPSEALGYVRDQWIKTKFRPLTIGVHVRMMGLGRLVGRADPTEFVPFFMKLARSLQKQRGVPDEHTAIYLATDRIYVPEAWQKYLENTSIALLTQREELVFTNQTAWEGLDRGSKEGLQIAVLEMLLLGASDEVIGTRASTFSHVAAAFGGVRPWIIGPHRGYYGSATSDPCFWHVKPQRQDWQDSTDRWFDFAPESFLHFPCAHF